MASKSQGIIRQRGDGTWSYRLEKGVQPCQVCPACREAKRRPFRYWIEGKPLKSCPRCGGELQRTELRRQDEVTGCKTQEEAKVRYRTEQSKIDAGTYVELPRRRQTVREYLEAWMEGLPVGREASTVAMYRSQIENYILPKLGAIPLAKLTADQITAFYAELIADGAVRRPKAAEKPADVPEGEPAAEEPVVKPLSRTTVRHTHAVLNRALREAVKRGHLARNPAAAADKPKTVKPKMTAWTAEQALAFLKATDADRLNPLWRLMVDRGLRREEACGLRWEDVDFDARVLSIQRVRRTVGYEVQEGPAKNDGSVRPIELNEHVVGALRAQAARQADDAQKWGTAWTDSGYVFTAEDGTPVHPDRVSKLFNKAVAASQLPRIRLHDLRHTCATIYLKAGVHPKVVQELLGHSKIETTLNLYSHVLPGMQKNAADLMGQLLSPTPPQAEDSAVQGPQ